MPVKPLLWGIDKLEGSFEVAGYLDNSEDLVKELMAKRGEAQLARKAQPHQIGGRTFLVQPKGRKFYELQLVHADMILWLTDYEKPGVPPVLVSISSEYLWAIGPFEAVKQVYVTLRLAGINPTADKCSRVDLMVDWAGRPLVHRDLYDIVCSSRKRLPLDGQFLAADERVRYIGQRVNEHGRDPDEGLDIRQYSIQKGRQVEMTGIVVALGQPLSWRGYNKSLEIERVSQKWWFLDIWRKNGWVGDPETGELPTVWRSEFQIRREVITDLEPILGRPLSSFRDVIEHAAAIWRFLTEEWLEFRDRKVDKCVTRCPLRRWWRGIQRPSIGLDWDSVDPVERLGNLRAAKRKVLDDMIAGCLAGVAAHQGTVGNLDGTIDGWMESAAQLLAGGELDTWREVWGEKAKARAVDYLVADLRAQLREKILGGGDIPDLAGVLRQWRDELDDKTRVKFRQASGIKEGQLPHGKGAIDGAEGRGNRSADTGSGAPVHAEREAGGEDEGSL